MSMRLVHRIPGAVVAMLAAQAAAFTCTGAVKGVALEATSGEVLAESIGTLQWPRFCSVRVAANGIAPESCKSVYAALLAAQASGRTATVWVNSTVTSCTTLAPWQFVEGFYFLRVDN